MSAVPTNFQHNAAMENLADVASDIADMSRAAATLGKPQQAALFWKLHLRLVAAHEGASEAFRRECHDHFKSTMQASVNMIGAAMAVDQKNASPKPSTSNQE